MCIVDDLTRWLYAKANKKKKNDRHRANEREEKNCWIFPQNKASNFEKRKQQNCKVPLDFHVETPLRVERDLSLYVFNVVIWLILVQLFSVMDVFFVERRGFDSWILSDCGDFCQINKNWGDFKMNEMRNGVLGDHISDLSGSGDKWG